MDTLKVDYSITKKGFSVYLNSKRLGLSYPSEIWDKFPRKIRKSIVENFVFLSTLCVPAMNGSKKIYYNMSSPLLGSFFLKPILYYIPTLAQEENLDSFSLLRTLLNTDYTFNSYKINHPDYKPKVKNRAIVLFTFGKDSLLTFSIAEEIGLNPVLIYIEEPDIVYQNGNSTQTTYENKHKEKLIKEFTKEFKKPVYKIKNDIAWVRYSEFFGETKKPELPTGSQLTEYALMSLPFNHYFKAKYLLYGNEASCSFNYATKDGFIAPSVYDQSRSWTIEISKLLKLLTGNVNALSLIEPIHEIMVTRILHTRYPHYGKYQMSCFADSNHAKHSRWCHNCSKCARIYMFLLANNINPKSVGFQHDMLAKDKMSYYSLFGIKGISRTYDMSGSGRDEQLLAFYLAYKNKAKGYLINEFKKKFLKEAKKREKELIQEYFGIHSSITMNERLKKKVLKVYQQYGQTN